MTVGIILLFVGLTIIPTLQASFLKNAPILSPVQLLINDDGSGDPTDKKVDVPTYLPDSGITPTITINFTIIGTNSTPSNEFYGDDPGEDWKNITVTGDVLYPVTHRTLYHIGTKGDWNCCITPTQPYGSLTLTIDWPGNGSADENIQIVNGTCVRPSVNSFPWGQDFNLTVTVTDIDGAPVKIANVYVIWEEDDYEFNHTSGDNTAGNGANGEYTFWITRDNQGEIAPKNITIAAQWYAGFWGYAKVIMERPSHPPLVYIDDDYNSATPGWG